jgi:hypothetical protein
MKRLRMVVLLAVTLSLLAAVLIWSRRTATARATTPAECLDDYYESLRSGDIDKYRGSLGEPYRARAEQRSFAAACREVEDVKDLVQLPGPVEQGASLWVDVDEVRTSGVRRLRYHLRSEGTGWVIVGIDPPREIAAPIRYGTPVGDAP